MSIKFTVALLAVVCSCALADKPVRRQQVYFVRGAGSAGEQLNLAPLPTIREDSGSGERRAVQVVESRPSYGYRQESDSGEDAKYQFSYRVRAHGAGKKYGYGAGSGSGEQGAQGGNDEGNSQEFGHSEARDGGRTTGSYFVQLPDGRLQKVEYYVEGDSGFVARVSYDGQAGSGEKLA